MKVLLLGNSFTFFHDMPKILASFMNAEVDSITRGGAYLYQMLDEQDELCTQVKAALSHQQWDYIILQEQSNTPALRPEIFHPSVAKLCKWIRQNGAKPVLYATWAYRDGTEKLASTNLSYDEMDRALHDAYHKAAAENGALVADVGRAFTALREIINVYEADDYHPSEAGSLLAAHVIGKVLEDDWNNR